MSKYYYDSDLPNPQQEFMLYECPLCQHTENDPEMMLTHYSEHLAQHEPIRAVVRVLHLNLCKGIRCKHPVMTRYKGMSVHRPPFKDIGEAHIAPGFVYINPHG